MAQEFVDTTGATTPLMVWDESFASWQYYGVTGQPSVILVDRTGQPLGAWRGTFDEQEVLDLIAAA